MPASERSYQLFNQVRLWIQAAMAIKIYNLLEGLDDQKCAASAPPSLYPQFGERLWGPPRSGSKSDLWPASLLTAASQVIYQNHQNQADLPRLSVHLGDITQTLQKTCTEAVFCVCAHDCCSPWLRGMSYLVRIGHRIRRAEITSVQ